MIVVVWISGALLLAGGLMAIVRAERGPSILDRTVALDILVTTLIAAIALYAALERRADAVPVLVALSLVGFVGSVTVARFAAVEPPGEGRVMTRWEEAVARAVQQAQESADDDLADDPANLADDPSGTDGPPSGEPASDQPTSSRPRPDVPESDEPRSGEPRFDEPGSGGRQHGGPRSGEPGSGEPGSGGLGSDGPGSGGLGSDGPGSGGLGSGGSRGADPEEAS